MTLTHAQRLGRLLRQRREALGLSTRQLEAASGVDDTSILRLERGVQSRPSIDKLEKLASALDLPIEDLLAVGRLTPRTGLPSFQPYLRAKYGHLPAAKRRELAEYFEAIEAEYGAKPKAAKRKAPKRTKGGQR